MGTMTAFLMGATAMASAAAGLIFLRHFKQTRDRLFLMFGLAFWVLALNRTALAWHQAPNEGSPVHYGVRCAAFLLIIYAIVQKNRGRAA